MPSKALNELKRAEVQKLAKLAGLRAIGATAEIRLRLLKKYPKGVPRRVAFNPQKEMEMAGVATQVSAVGSQNTGPSGLGARQGSGASQGTTAHNMTSQQAGQGSPMRAPSVSHTSAAGDHFDAQGAHNLPPVQSAARASPEDELPSAPFAYIAATDSWIFAAPGQRCAHPYWSPRDGLHLNRWVADPAAESAPAPAPASMPRPVIRSTSVENAEREMAQWEQDDISLYKRVIEIDKMKRGIDETMATVTAGLDQLTAKRIVVERHVLPRLKENRALLGQAAWVRDPGYLQWLGTQRCEQDGGARGVDENLRHGFIPLTGGEESDEEDFSQFRRKKSSTATPYRLRKRPSDDSESDTETSSRAQKRRRS
ncbi:hypothetical protein B0H21DRAFT_773557 [Amylocystis lapponica]|nr:hypothetical protein B0H21DRAFT_773557 [Amylocystis lapponica]